MFSIKLTYVSKGYQKTIKDRITHTATSPARRDPVANTLRRSKKYRNKIVLAAEDVEEVVVDAEAAPEDASPEVLVTTRVVVPVAVSTAPLLEEVVLSAIAVYVLRYDISNHALSYFGLPGPTT